MEMRRAAAFSASSNCPVCRGKGSSPGSWRTGWRAAARKASIAAWTPAGWLRAARWAGRVTTRIIEWTWMALQDRWDTVRERIVLAAQRAGRKPDEITLLAVTKVFPVEVLLEA